MPRRTAYRDKLLRSLDPRQPSLTDEQPTITIQSVDGRRVDFRLEGGKLAAGWAPGPGETAWCRVTVYFDERGGIVGSFGGEVWPSAWPHLFHVGPRTVHGQATTLTEAGEALVRDAIRQHAAAATVPEVSHV